MIRGVIALLAISLAGEAAGQSISNLAVAPNVGNSGAELVDDLLGIGEAYQRKTTVAVQSAGTNTFTVRYAEAVGADVGLAGLAARTETQASDYTISFDVTAPGAYRLLVATRLKGAFTLVDTGNTAAADVSPVTGTQTGGTIGGGSLGSGDPGSLATGGGGNTGFDVTGAAQVDGTSDGVVQSHTLRFTWSASCTSTPALVILPGDECAVRLGLALDYSGTAGDYPGIGARTQLDDGHFVTVTLVSLCGNGTVDAGEDCDDGNTTNGDCCSSSCHFESAGTTCRPSAGVCDVAETCTGASAPCPANAFVSSGTVCRSSAGVCDVAESCTGSSASCPADGFVPSGTLCRSLAGVCDVEDKCNGASAQCPANAFVPSGTVCRSSAGVCDVAETCDGASAACPADARLPSGTTCRSSAGACDVAESCDGASALCPADVLVPSGMLCRQSAGVCDVAETCSGVGAACPADAFVASGILCRATAGACDVEETCSGTAAACPADTSLPDADGDGLCDDVDTCSMTPAGGAVDADGDGVEDACDPCSNVVPILAAPVNLRLTRATTNRQRLSIHGTMAIPNAMRAHVNPLDDGVRLLLVGKSGTVYADVAAPPTPYDARRGMGWQVAHNGLIWLYRDQGLGGPPAGGIDRIGVRLRGTVVEFLVKGTSDAYAAAAADTPFVATLVFDPPIAEAGACGEATFPQAACSVRKNGATVVCRVKRGAQAMVR
jgi:cysteine-rich repeat protein